MLLALRMNWSRYALATLALSTIAIAFVARAQAVVRTGGARTTAARTSVHASQVNVTRNVNVTQVHNDRWGHPLATAAAVTATAVAVGTIAASIPPNCATLVAGGVTYRNCGGVYYQPVYQGTAVQYVVVEAPR